MPPPPHDYLPGKHQFRDAATGRLVRRREVKQEIDKLIRHIKEKAKTYAEQVDSGQITPAEFEIEMRELLKSGHIIAASVGRGGRERMNQSDWGWVGSKIKWQYGYLRKFTDKVIKGKVKSPVTPARAQKYASSIYISFYQTVARDNQESGSKDKVLVKRVLNAKESCPDCRHYAAKGYIPVSEQPLLGELSCGDFCRCDLVFKNEPETE